MSRRSQRRSRTNQSHKTSNAQQHKVRPKDSPVFEPMEGRLLLATHVWTGAVDSLWSNAGNWTGGAPTSGEGGGTIVQFNGASTSTDDIAGLVVSEVHFTAGGNTLNGSTSLGLLGGVTAVQVLNDTGTNTFSASLPVVNSGAATVITITAGTVDMNSTITGTQGITLSTTSTAGTLVFTGNNGYTGTTTVNAGTLQLNGATVNTAVPGTLAIGDGAGAAGSAKVQLMQANQIANSATVTVNGPDGQFDVGGFAETVGALTITSSSGSGVVSNSSLLSLTGTLTMTEAGNTGLALSGSDLVVTNGATAIITMPLAGFTGLAVNGTAGNNDHLTIDNTGNLIAQLPSFTYNGGAGTGDELILTGTTNSVTSEVYDATGGGGAGTLVVNTGGAFSNSRTITFLGLEPVIDLMASPQLTVTGSNAGDTVVINNVDGVQSTFQTGTVNITSIGGYERVIFANKTAVTFNDGSGVDAITVNMATRPTGLTTLNVNAGSGNDEIDVTATPASVTTNTDTESGNPDRTVIGATYATFNTGAGTLDNINGPVNVNDSGGVGQLYVDDSGAAAADTNVVFTSTSITGAAPAVIGYGANITTVQLATTALGDTVNVRSTSSTAVTTLYGNAGNDTFNVSSDAPTNNGNLAGIAGELDINPDGGIDALNISDSGAVGPLTMTIANTGGNTTTISGNWGASIVYAYDPATASAVAAGSGLEILNITGSAGNDTFTVTNTSASTSTAISGYSGNDTFNINADNLSGGIDTFQGGSGNDTINFTITTNIGSATVNTYAINTVAIGGGDNTAPGRDTLFFTDNSGAIRNVGFDYGDAAGSVDITGFANAKFIGTDAAVNVTTMETVRYDGSLTANNDIVTVKGTSGDDDITVAPQSTTSALVFISGNPMLDGSQTFTSSLPGVGSGTGYHSDTAGPDLWIKGISAASQLTVDGNDADGSGDSTLGDRLIVYGRSETQVFDSTVGAPDYFGFGAGVVIPSVANPTAYDAITVDPSGLHLAFDGVQITGLIGVAIANDSFNPIIPLDRIDNSSVIVNAGEEAMPADQPVGYADTAQHADVITAYVAYDLGITVNGNLPSLDTDRPFDGDQLIATFPNELNIWSDTAADGPNVHANSTNIATGAPTGGLQFSSIEDTLFYPVNTVTNIVGDDNNTVSQDDTFTVTGGDVDWGTGLSFQDIDGCNEFQLVINGSNPIKIANTSFLNITDYTGDNTLNITPYANNTVANWGIDVRFNGVSDEPADGGSSVHNTINYDPANLLLPIGYSGVSGVSEDIAVRPSGAGSGQIVVPDVVTITYTGTDDLTFTGNGGAAGDTDTLTVYGTSGGDAYSTDFSADGLVDSPWITMGGFGDIQNFSNFDEVNFSLLGGNDSLTVNKGDGTNPVTINYDGGLGADILTIQGATAASSDEITFNTAPTPGSGRDVMTIGDHTQQINFQNLEPVLDTVPGPLIVDGTNGNDAINYTVGSVTTNGLVSVNDSETIEFTHKTLLTINALAGSDEINLNNPNVPTGLTGITVAGSDPTGSDTLIVNGIAGTDDDLLVLPTATGAGQVQDTGVTAFVPVTFTGIEHLTVLGQLADDDGVRISGTVTDDAYTFTPGATGDAGTITGTAADATFTIVPVLVGGFYDYIVPISEGLADGGSDSLIINGTAADDTITFTANVAFPPGGDFPTVTVNAGTPLFYERNLAYLTLQGLDGNDTFTTDFSTVNAYASALVTINGGDPDWVGDTLNYVSNADAATTINLGASTIDSTGANTVAFAGIEDISETSSGTTPTLTIQGTSGSDDFEYTPTDTTAGVVVDNGAPPQIEFTGVAGAFTIDPLTGGTNTVTVNGTASGDTINVVKGTSATTVRVNSLKTVSVTSADTQVLVVEAGLGDDTINVSGTGGPALTVDGDQPTASDTLTITNTTAGTTTVSPGNTADSGVITTPDGTTSFEDIEYITLTGAAGTNTLNMLGRSGSDLIKLEAASGNQVLVNDRAPVTFSSFGTVNLDGVAGNDTYNVSPVGLTGVTAITVSGHAPVGTSDTVINGSTAAETFTIATASASSTVVTVGTSAPVTVNNPSSVVLNGLEGNDTFTTSTATALSAPITLNGGAGNDVFNVGLYTGALVLYGDQGSDTLNLSAATVGATVDLDKTGVAQKINTTGETLNLTDAIENFVGTSFNDKVYVDALAVPRSISLGNPDEPNSALIPPGDFLSIDSQAQFMTVNRIVAGQPSDDSGTATAFSYQPITFTGVEKLAITNNLGSVGFGDTNQTPYTRAVKYPTSTKKPTVVVTGDVNGDGWADAVTASKNNGKISVMLGDGDGTFAPAVVYNTGLINVEDMVLADMDNDGNLDIVISGKTNGPATYGKNRVMILDGNGDGTFAAPVQYITHLKGPTVTLAVADVDGDGYKDVMIAGTQEVRLLLNDGTGALDPVQLVLSRGYSTNKIILQDINGDGDVDLITANYNKNYVSTFLNNGSGVFGLVDPLHTNNRLANGNFFTGKKNTYAGGKTPTSMAIADFNNDGLYDIVVSNKNGNAISVLLGNPDAVGASDAFTLQVEPHYETRGYVAVAAGDLNGDGKQDLVMVKESSSDQAVVLLGDGNGTFSSTVTVSFDDVERRQPSAIAIADVNNDGGLDILVANQGARNLTVLLKNPVI